MGGDVWVSKVPALAPTYSPHPWPDHTLRTRVRVRSNERKTDPPKGARDGCLRGTPRSSSQAYDCGNPGLSGRVGGFVGSRPGTDAGELLVGLAHNE
jgi:hypothetical protein